MSQVTSLTTSLCPLASSPVTITTVDKHYGLSAKISLIRSQHCAAELRYANTDDKQHAFVDSCSRWLDIGVPSSAEREDHLGIRRFCTPIDVHIMN